MKISSRKAISYLVLTSLLLTCFVTELRADNPAGSPAKGSSRNGLAESNSQGLDKENTEGKVAESKPENPSVDEANALVESPEKAKSEHKHAYTTLKPGQRLKIAGFAEKQDAVVLEDPLSDQKPGAYNQAQMRVTGSMCYACLHEFEEKLKLIYGVERVKVEKSKQASIQTYSPELANWADANIIYDSQKLDFTDLRAYMRSNGYFPYKVVYKTLDSLPPAEQKKTK